MNNNEIAAFENFKFGIGQLVRPITERVNRDLTIERARQTNMQVEILPVMGMVVARGLVQDEAGISRFYQLRGVNCAGSVKEFEIEAVEQG